jgi:hypothetical protein
MQDWRKSSFRGKNSIKGSKKSVPAGDGRFL